MSSRKEQPLEKKREISLDDVVSIDARLKTLQGKLDKQSRGGKEKQKKLESELRQVGLLQPKEDVKAGTAPRTQSDQEVQTLFETMEDIDGMIDMFATGVTDNAENSWIVTWVSINRLMEKLGYLNSSIADEFYATANTHLFYSELLFHIDDDTVITPAAFSAFPGLHTKSVGNDWETLKPGEKFENEWDAKKALNEEFNRVKDENVNNVMDYIEKIKGAVAQTKATFQQRGAVAGAGAAATMVGGAAKGALGSALKRIWSGVKSIGPADFVNLAMLFMREWTKSAPANDSTMAGQFNQYTEAYDALVEKARSSKIVERVNVFSRVNYVFEVLPFKVPTFQSPTGLGTSKDIDDTNPMLFIAGARGQVDAINAWTRTRNARTPIASDSKYQFVRGMWMAVKLALPGNVAAELTVIIFNLILRAVGALATLSKDRIDVWMKRNGSHLKTARIAVLNTYFKKVRASKKAIDDYGDCIETDTILANNGRMDQFVRANLTRLETGAATYNKAWAYAVKDHASNMETWTNVFSRWFDNSWTRYVVTEGMRGASALARIRTAGGYVNSKYAALATGVVEAAAFAYWRYNASKYIQAMNKAIDMTTRIKDSLSNSIAPNMYKELMQEVENCVAEVEQRQPKDITDKWNLISAWEKANKTPIPLSAEEQREKDEMELREFERDGILLPNDNGEVGGGMVVD